MPEMDGYEVAKRLRVNPLTAKIPILMFTAKTQLDDKVSGLEAGADDYLTKPTHPTELRAHVKALLARSNKSKTPTSPLPSGERSLTIGILAPRGGQGVTTVAVNLGDALRIASSSEVIVAELRPGMGTLGHELSEISSGALSELLSANLPDISRQMILNKLHTHANGLRLLFGSERAKDGLLADAPEKLEALATQMSLLAPYLVLDLGAGLSPLNQKLLSACSILLVLVEPVTNSVLYSKALIADLATLIGSKRNIHTVVVNRIPSITPVPMAQMEETLGQAPLLTIGPAPELFSVASSMKTTAVSCDPGSTTYQQFIRLAHDILEHGKPKG